MGYVPEPVEEVVAAWQAYNEERSQEPARYWSAAKQQFRALNVTKEEKSRLPRAVGLLVIQKKHLRRWRLWSNKLPSSTFEFVGQSKDDDHPGVIDTQFPY
ncbi:MAG: hypothetical protein H7A03_11120 [Pseudomonadales bacterium]|nr:hypothetical protein [Pseudomonadales bacterium]